MTHTHTHAHAYAHPRTHTHNTPKQMAQQSRTAFLLRVLILEVGDERSGCKAMSKRGKQAIGNLALAHADLGAFARLPSACACEVGRQCSDCQKQIPQPSHSQHSVSVCRLP